VHAYLVNPSTQDYYLASYISHLSSNRESGRFYHHRWHLSE
jgi:hypothetical protein